MNYSACWRSKKVIISTSDVIPLISEQNRVVIVSSVIANIFIPSKCWTVTIQPFESLSYKSVLVIIICCQFTIVRLLFRAYSIQCSILLFSVQLLGKCSVLILEMCSIYFDPVNNNHQQSINIIHQTAPSFVLVQEGVAYYNHRHRMRYMEPIFSIGLADGESILLWDILL